MDPVKNTTTYTDNIEHFKRGLGYFSNGGWAPTEKGKKGIIFLEAAFPRA